MENKNHDGAQLDYYAANDDWAGIRTLEDSQEIVQYHTNSGIRIWCNEQSIDYDPHWHVSLEIIMPIENFYDAEINQQLYHVNPGEFLFIPPHELHKLMAPETGRRFILLLDISALLSLRSGSSIQSLLMQPIHVTQDTYPQIYRDIYQHLHQITEEYFSKNEFAELTIYSLLLDLFAKFAYNHIYQKELFPNVRTARQKEYIKKFNNLLEYIDEHYSEDLNLENMADYMGFSKFHFSRLFKQYTDLTFNDYLHSRRLKASEALLANPNLPIIEVALQSGYTSISTFNRLFKQYKHCTPSEYRSRKQGKY